METIVKAFGTTSPEAPLSEMTIPRRELLPKDVEVDILYCGVCHTDLHMSRNDVGYSVYPMVPGHEIVGRVTRIGSEVTKFQIGDIAAIGPIAGSCGHCKNCNSNREVYCENGITATYNSPDKHMPGKATYGGYSERIIVDEHFTFTVPGNLELAGVGPLLCAGATVWAPLRTENIGKGSKVAVIGLGGLGHLAIKLAKALGAEVSLFSRTPGKAQDALQLGATRVIISTDKEQMAAVQSSFDLIIDTVPYNHDVNPYIQTLALDGNLVLVGFFGELTPTVHSGVLAMNNRSLSAAYSDTGIEAQKMLDFCGEHNIVSDIELIKMQEVNEAFERMEKGDVKYRFVIDMTSLKN
jgi:alcohol dehydrogenase (NADP+)